MPLLDARTELKLSQALLKGWIGSGLNSLDLPLRLLRFPLGRLQKGTLAHFELDKDFCALVVQFVSGPALRIKIQVLGYLPATQVLRLRIEQLQFSGFRGAPVLNLIPGRVLEMLCTQANQRLPGLLEAGKNMEISLHLVPLLQKVLQEIPLEGLRRSGLEIHPEVRVEHLELSEKQLWLTFSASG